MNYSSSSLYLAITPRYQSFSYFNQSPGERNLILEKNRTDLEIQTEIAKNKITSPLMTMPILIWVQYVLGVWVMFLFTKFCLIWFTVHRLFIC